MKIIEIHLLAFGPFSDLRLDLAPGDTDLHFIYGPNEAGKSASLRALKALFYGIPPRTNDNFLHDNQSLRIGARVKRSDGDEGHFLRRKGRKDTLLDDNGNPLPEASLERFLNGASEDLFSNMFGIDHETLVRGAEQILQGGGALGESLFAAGIGGTNIREVLKGLEEEAAKLFLPKGKVQLIPSKINEYRENRQNSLRASLPGREWVEHDEVLRKAVKERLRIDGELAKLDSEKNRLQRLQRAIPKIAERQELATKLHTLGTVKILPPSFSKKRLEALQELDKARESERAAVEALTKISAKLGNLSIPEGVLHQADNIIALVELLGSHRKAFKDLPRLRGEKNQLKMDAIAIMKELGPNHSLEDIETLRLSAAKRAKIREMGQNYSALTDRLKRADQELKKREAKLKEKREDLQTMAAPANFEELRAALARAMEQGKIEQELQAAIIELDAGIKHAAVDLKKLGMWSGSLEELEALAVPSSETVNRFESGFNALERELQAVQDRIKHTTSDKNDLQTRLSELQMTGLVPNEVDLENSRNRRQQGWQLVRQSWLEGIDNQQAAIDFDPESPLDAAFEKSVAQADEIADRLRREADRVAQHASLIAQLERHSEDLRLFHREEQRIEQQIKGLRREWSDLWRLAGFEPLSPSEMRAWIVKQDKLVQLGLKLQEDRQRIELLQHRILEHCNALRQSMESLGETALKPEEKLESLIHRGRTMIDKLEAAAQKRELLQKAAKQAEDDLISAQQSREESSDDLLRWRHEWSVALDLLGLPGDSSPTEANVVLDKIEELFKKVDSLSSLETRIAGILRDGEDFQNDVTALVERVAPDLEALPPEQSVPELNKRLQAAQKDSAAFNELKEQQKEREETIQRAHRIIHNCELKLKELCRTANCLEFDELIEVEERSSKAQTIMAGIESLDKQLLEYSGGSSIEAVIAEAEEVDADALPAQIMSLTTRIEEMAAKRSELIEEIGREKTKLALMDGSATAAEAAERTQSTLAEIRDYANRYIRLRLASTILHREIERYRSENQDPMLHRSSEIFAHLCLGSFVGLQADFNELDEPILLGVRGNGKRVTVQGMSEGTRDQLYLALRLASLEKYLEHNEAMPLIVDDILINFDDERAKATLQVLADLSRKTQVIFFTHHIHLVELAKACTLPCHVISLGN